MIRAATIAILAIAFTSVATAQSSRNDRRTPTIDDLIAVETIGEVALSPDGRRVVYTQTAADFTEDKYTTHLWLVDHATRESRQLTRGEDSTTRPRWSPDGKWIAFLASRDDDSAQIHLIQPDGGEAFAITNSPSAVRAMEWSPDGAHIAFTAPAPEPDDAEKREEHFGDYAVVRREYRHVHLFTLDLIDALENPLEGEQRTRGEDFSIGAFSWSPDATRIAFDATSNPDIINLHTRNLYVLSLEDDAVETLVDDTGPASVPLWSPDGQQIAFATVPGRREFFPYNQEIAVVRARGGTSRIVTGSFDESAHPLAWTSSGIHFTALQRTAGHLFRIHPFTGVITRVSDPADLMGRSFSIDEDGTAFAFIAGTTESLPDVYIQRNEATLPVALTEMTRQVNQLDLARRDIIRWESEDGTEIEGILHKPRDFNPFRKYPLLVVIHGGPTGIDRPGLLQGATYYPVDIWTSRDALVLRVNYRGSAGYGEAFRTLNMRNLGVGDAWDVESGVQHLINQGYVDPERIGCMGWSQGGYISAFLTTNSETFAAISVGAGISNWATYYYNTDITPFTINYLGADPASDPGIYTKTSPMTNILRANTPTLIQHGQNDARVPIPNAYELRQGLEDRGVPVEMIVYNGFGHGINKPRARRAVLQHNLDWFNHHLWGDPLPDWTNPNIPEKENENP